MGLKAQAQGQPGGLHPTASLGGQDEQRPLPAASTATTSGCLPRLPSRPRRQLPFMKNRQVGRGLTFRSLGSFTSPSSKSSSWNRGHHLTKVDGSATPPPPPRLEHRSWAREALAHSALIPANGPSLGSYPHLGAEGSRDKYYISTVGHSVLPTAGFYTL